MAAVDVAADKLALAQALEAELMINAVTADPVAVVQDQTGGAHGLLFAAVLRVFLPWACMMRQRGTLALMGLSLGDFPLNNLDVKLAGKTVRVSIVSIRQDVVESLAFAAAGRVKVHCPCERLEDINQVIAAFSENYVDGRAMIDLSL